MTEKMLRKDKEKAALTGAALAPDYVVVGTYKAGQLDWINKNGVYNWPVREGDDFAAETFSRITELWLYANAKSSCHTFSAQFIGRKTQGEFLAENPSYTKLGGPKNSAYYVFKVKALDYPAEIDNQLFLARTADFGGRSAKIKKAIEKFKADGEFEPLSKYLPKVLAAIPSEQLHICDGGVQLEFVFSDSVEENREVNTDAHDVDLPVISLFSGAGGLDIGFSQAGFRTAVMVEFDPACCRTLRKNRPNTPIIEGDINHIATSSILSAAGLKPLEAALVIGGPPCQSFSLAGKRMGLNDPRGKLVLEFIRVVRESLPKAFVMENVRGLTNWEKGKALNAIITESEEPIEYNGKMYTYKVCYKILNAADFGAPQFRERVFIVGNRVNCDYKFPLKQFGPYGNAEGLKPYVTVRDAICNLPPATPPSDVAMRVSGTIKARIEKHGY